MDTYMISSTLATSCEELTNWKWLWCWEGLGAEGGEGDNRGWDGWKASLTRCTWVWVNSGSWWWTGRPGVLRFMGSQRVGHDWVTELNWRHFWRHVSEVNLSVLPWDSWAWCVGNEKISFKAPCSETEEQMMQDWVICCRSERRLG